ncbi:MAG TPA: outer membrane protein transport protein [Fluviicoccus sp.]|nr:outer membrane protein transport protein [Fluviicoccus sp.]
MSRLFIRLSPLALALAAVSPAHATNGYLANGYGLSSEGAGGVAAALPQDALVIATNPAGISALDNRLDASINYFVPKREASITGNGFAPDATYDGNGKKSFLIPAFGYVHRLNPALTFGLAVYGNGGMNTVYQTNPYQRFGATGEAGVNLEQLFVTPALSWKVNDRNSLGIAANLAYQRFEAKGLSPFAGFSIDPAHLTDQGLDSSTGAGVRLGWLGTPIDRLSLGAGWASKISTGHFDKYRGLFAGEGGFDIPETLTLGAALKPADGLTVALDWQKIKYSDVAAVGNPIANLFQGNPLGSANGGGFGWKDISVLKLGVVYDLSKDLTLRAGYAKAGQPVPQGETFFNILAPGVITKHWTLGATWHLNPRNEVSVAYTRALKETVNGVHSIPPGAPPAGLGGGEANVSLSENILGIGWGLKL